MKSKPEYRIQQVWSDIHAEYVYNLEKRYSTDKSWEETIYDGDEHWAVQQAKHYNCSIIHESGHTMKINNGIILNTLGD